MVVPIIGPGSGRPIPQDAATELPLSIFFPDCSIPPFGMQTHEGWRIRHPWSQFVCKSQSLAIERQRFGGVVFSLVAESYVGILAVSVLFAETFALAVRRVDLRQIGTVCTIDRMPVLGCLPSEPEIAAVNASWAGFRTCLQLCVLKGNAPAFSLTCVADFSKVHGTLLSGFCIASGVRIFLLASRRPRVMSEDNTIAMSLAHRRRGEKEKRSMGCRRAGLRFTGFPSWRDCGVSGGLPPLFENGKSADVSEVDLLVLISPRPKSLTLPAYWVQ
ncbi:hypothetical protein CSIM01_13307 [Colletotrichum simmondsii]|uniref:Uncharacterized protein n=1 Tax=Colletotrichum simmondsii TaxID=703756 RepID=A0A135RSY9_9PEZI|nr:hypothetical protein CSIM01_13307 [Colletotrichum simmondsii]